MTEETKKTKQVTLVELLVDGLNLESLNPDILNKIVGWHKKYTIEYNIHRGEKELLHPTRDYLESRNSYVKEKIMEELRQYEGRK